MLILNFLYELTFTKFLSLAIVELVLRYREDTYPRSCKNLLKTDVLVYSAICYSDLVIGVCCFDG